ncbi:MAG: efflux RND transporter periplasmic adaptor subunit [Sulfurimonadaceae bacterium]
MADKMIEQTLGVGVHKKRSFKIYFILLSILVLMSGAFFWYKSGKNKNEIEYLSAPLERKTITVMVDASGNMEPTNSVDVGIEVSGTISDVLVDYNQHVKKGEVMARLDTVKLSSKVTSYQAALAKYEANVAEATATLTKSKNEWLRVEKMIKATNGGYPSKQEVDSAYAAYELSLASLEVAKAGRNQANAELKAAQDDLKKAVVVSPIEGVVLAKKVEAGQSVVAAMTVPVLFSLAEDLTKMKVIVSVDEADIADVKEAQSVEFSVDAYPQKTFKGVVTQLRLNSQIVNGVVTYDAVVDVQNPELLLRPGMTVFAHIVTDVIKDALVVPNAALRFTPPMQKRDAMGEYVWVLRENKPFKIALKVGKSDGSFSVIQSAELSERDAVLVGIKEP